MFLPGFPDLNKKLYVLLNLEKKLIPKVYNVFKKNDIIPFSYASEWFLCLFSRSLKFNSLVRIFDCFILEGYKIISDSHKQTLINECIDEYAGYMEVLSFTVYF